MYPDLYSEYGSFMNTDPICIRIHNIAYSNRKIFKEENVKKIVVVDPPDIFFSCGEAGAGDEPAPSEPLQEGPGLQLLILLISFSAAEKQELGMNPPPLNHYRKVLVYSC